MTCLHLIFAGSELVYFNMEEELQLEQIWDGIDEVQSLEPVVDRDRDHLPEALFDQYKGRWNTTGYADCEEMANSQVRLFLERPMTSGSIRHISISNPIGIVPPLILGALLPSSTMVQKDVAEY